MPLRYLLLCAMLIGVQPAGAAAQSDPATGSVLQLELNGLRDVGGACRLTFVTQNQTGSAIDRAVFETVIFDTSGAVVSLTLFDFRDLPLDRMRVRQFDLPGTECGSVGRALVNGANTCTVQGADSDVCDTMLQLSSRAQVELLG